MRVEIIGWLVGCCTLFGPTAAAAARPPSPASPRKNARPVSAAPKPNPPAVGLTKANLPRILQALGLQTRAVGPYYQLTVDEEKYGYKIDLGLSKSGEWLVCMAHLATVPDLTAVRSAPLLSLLAANDSLLGMAFSYDRTNGRIMLNASAPSRSLDAPGLRRLLDRLLAAVKEHQGLWDTANW